MKNLLFSAITVLGLMLGTTAHASYSDINVLEVKQYANFMPPIPEGVNPVRTHITITYTSCAAFGDDRFEVALAAEGGDKFPTLIVSVAPNTMDCMGPTRIRTTTLKRNSFVQLDFVMAPQNGKLVLLKVDQNFVY